eukprot:4368599-Pleurochrysis_carterae.AAC.2
MLAHLALHQATPHNSSLCPMPSSANHNSSTAATHTAPSGFDAAAIIAEYGKAPTEAQQKRASANAGRACARPY